MCVFLVQVDTSEEGRGDVTATATSPSGDVEELDVSNIDDNTYHVSFTPSQKGVHMSYVQTCL